MPGEEESVRPDGPAEWTYRALGQQSYPSVSGSGYGSIRGFGLLQRDRDPARYADPETRYEDRPSLWCTPLPLDPFGTGPGAAGLNASSEMNWDDVPNVWAGGTVELLEYPTDFEGFDNIAAWWVPAVKPTVGEPYPLAYTLTFLSGDPPEHSLAKAAAWTRAVDPEDPAATRLTVDFVGVPPGEETTLRIATRGGPHRDTSTTPMPDGRVRVTLSVRPDGDGPVTVEVTIFPKSSGDPGEPPAANDDPDPATSNRNAPAPPDERSSGPLSETWRFLCPPRL